MFDYWQARLDNLWRSRHRKGLWRGKFGGQTDEVRAERVPPPVSGFPRAAGSISRGRALLAFMPEAVRLWQNGGKPSHFNPHGASLEWALALSRAGYETDVVHYDDPNLPRQADYDLVVAHVGRVASRMARELSPGVPVIRYATTAHWAWFEEQTAARYRDLTLRRQLPEQPAPRRLLRVEMEKELDARADLVVALGEMTARKYCDAGINAVCIHNAAYMGAAGDGSLIGFQSTGRGFFYQGGSACVQKGLDLLIEAFAGEPDLQLYMDSFLEPDLLAAYRRELSLPNIHFARPALKFRRMRRKIEAECPFLIYAGLNSGQSTAMVAGTALGRIPVVTDTADVPWPEDLVQIASADVCAVRSAIRMAVGMPSAQRGQMAKAARDGFTKYFSPEAFASSLDRVLAMVHSR